MGFSIKKYVTPLMLMIWKISGGRVKVVGIAGEGDQCKKEVKVSKKSISSTWSSFFFPFFGKLQYRLPFYKHKNIIYNIIYLSLFSDFYILIKEKHVLEKLRIVYGYLSFKFELIFLFFFSFE